MFENFWKGVKAYQAPKDRSHKMTLFTVGEESKTCLIHVLDDRIVVSTHNPKTTPESREAVMQARRDGWRLPLLHSIETQIPYWKITRLLLEDKSSEGHSFHGLGIEFEDEEGAGTLMVFANGFRSANRVETLSEAIQKAQKELVRGLNLPEIEVIDLPAIRAYVGSGIIHRGK